MLLDTQPNTPAPMSPPTPATPATAATAVATTAPLEHERTVVRLDPDHPGFRDHAYRQRRDEIAQLAAGYVSGTPVPDAPYTAEEHAAWATICAALEPQHQQHACAQYLRSAKAINLPRHRIPQLREVTVEVEARSGFRLEPVAGLVTPRLFLESLADGVFLSTQYIRHHSAPLYTPEPDVAHEVIGHASMLADPHIAELSRLVGAAVKRTTSEEALARLGRLYWFTLEFGVLREAGEVKAYGAGLLSSAGELAAMRDAELLPFDLDAASRQDYDTTHFQPVLFCADSFAAMYETLRDYLINWR